MAKAGRPAVVLTDKDREEIKKLAGLTLSMQEIGLIKKIDPKTLLKYCKQEIEEGRAAAKTMATNQLFLNIKRGKEASLIFYLKTQHHWKETHKIEASAEVTHTLGVLRDKPLTAIEWEATFADTTEATDIVGTAIGTTTRSS